MNSRFTPGRRWNALVNHFQVRCPQNVFMAHMTEDTTTHQHLLMLDSPSLDIRAVAAYLGVSPRTIDRLKNAGALGYTKVGRRQIRFSLQDVARYVARNEVREVA